MTGNRTKGRWRRVLRYIFGGTLCLLTVVAARTGLPWYWAVVMFCVAFLLILGRRRIFRAGVSRTADELVCRYIPWYEGNAYFLNVGIPLIAVASIAAGFAPGNPAWLRFTGFILLGLMPLIVYSTVNIWSRGILCITPSALTVRLAAAPKDGLTEIRRERIQSITPKMVPNSVNGITSLQVEIAYHPVDSSDNTKTVMLGLYLSVQPINLLNALMAWNDAIHDNPSELLDRIEGILRGRSTADV